MTKLHGQLFRAIGGGALLAAIIGLNVLILSRPGLIEQLQSVGLFGLFGLSILSGFNVIVPIPIAALYPSFEALGYSAPVIIGVIATGMTLGDSIGYVLGMLGRSIVPTKGKIQQYVLRYTHRPVLLSFLVLVYGMVIPLPNELIVIPLAALGVRWYLILIPLLIGNIFFTTLLAFGATGITQLFL